MEIGDRVGIFILRLIDKLSANFEFHIQWIPSHVGILGNEIADSLAKTITLDTPRPDVLSTFNKMFSDIKKSKMISGELLLNMSCPKHILVVPYYLKADRVQQT
ncbi:hypothetical protein TNCV_4873391 [Trichonephila clavipes]|nr:hypothetical protein TNCV_4873391 [Trichonephila clavipes]